MSESRFAAFQAEHLAQGFDEVLERQWKPGTVIDTHTADDIFALGRELLAARAG